MENLFRYANGLLPNLFTETNELVEKYRSILSSWKFLHSGEVENLRMIFEEELHDVRSLVKLIKREYPNVRASEDEKVAEATKIRQLAELHSLHFQKRVSEVLRITSLGSMFFMNSLEYFEKYEHASGFAPFPPDEQFELFIILGLDFANFNAQLEMLKANFREQILLIDQKIRIHLNIETPGYGEEKAALAERGTSFELGRYAFVRSVRAESYRNALRHIFKTFEDDFDVISQRALAHKIDISIIRLMK